jgi:hypothetical protein
MDPRRISAILNAASAAMGERTSGLVSRRACSGGCIHTAEIWRPTIGPRFFVKFGDASCVDMFRQESIGLAEIRATQTVRVPHTIALVDRSDLDLSALILEAIDVGSPSSKIGTSSANHWLDCTKSADHHDSALPEITTWVQRRNPMAGITTGFAFLLSNASAFRSVGRGHNTRQRNLFSCDVNA